MKANVQRASWLDLFYNTVFAVFFIAISTYGLLMGELFIPVLKEGELHRQYFRELPLLILVVGFLVMSFQLSIKPLKHLNLIRSIPTYVSVILYAVAIVLVVTSLKINNL